MEQIILAVDPGREKCGLAVVHQTTGVVTQQVVQTAQLKTVVTKLVEKYTINVVVMGDGTTSKDAKQVVDQIMVDGQALMVTLIDERHSTDQARRRYWREHPPRGFMKLIPVTMQVPPVPVDDYVAVLLAERYFTEKV